ncbi:MAG: glycerophosphoryl diester phosphodiesterase [Myxococcota bacterium]|jgi:glycerophosphoryl diester phosphodiesterase
MSLKIFSHRGVTGKKIKENTLESLQNAYKKNYKALEFDIWYSKNQLVLRHNRPHNLTRLTKLVDVFAEFGNNVDYWLDFKNLNTRNCESAIKSVKKMIDDANIKNKRIFFAPFILDFKKAQKVYEVIRNYFGQKVQILAVVRQVDPEDYQKLYQILKTNNVSGISIQHRNINSEFRKLFHDIEIFAWTVNRQKTCDFMKEIGVDNIASDKLKPKD